jgi:hypothetical protein
LSVLKLRRTNKTDDWLTPPELVRSLGAFDLDPCASNRSQVELAATNYRLPEHNGLLEPWSGRVWCNPPFSQMSAWAHRFAAHGNGVMICPLRMQVRWAQVLFDHADAILFLSEAVRWVSPDGLTALGNLFDFMLVAFGVNNAEALLSCRIPGRLSLTHTHNRVMVQSWHH